MTRSNLVGIVRINRGQAVMGDDADDRLTMGKREAVRDLHDASPWFARDRGDGAFDLGGVAGGGGARLDAERGAAASMVRRNVPA
jgi:hypothetical protein